MQATGGLSGASLDSIVTALNDLQESMSGWGVPPPGEGWKAWSKSYQNATKDAKSAFEIEGMSPVSKSGCQELVVGRRGLFGGRRENFTASADSLSSTHSSHLRLIGIPGCSFDWGIEVNAD